MVTPARLLDLTRLVSRLGRGPLTGVDRVELAYLQHLLSCPEPLFGLVRTSVGFILLDRKGSLAVHRLATGAEPPGATDLIGRLLHRRDPQRARAEASARRLAVARCTLFGLAPMLRRHLPAGASYLNTGHANLTQRTLGAVKASGGRVAVLVHDVIPLEHPEFTRPDIPAVFARKLAAVADHADLLIHTTRDARRRTEAHLPRSVPGVVAALGVDLAAPDHAALPALDLRRPYFVTIGTIEPRKNHALLLDVWQRLHDILPEAEIPRLFLLGGRGWRNEAVFARLDRAPFMGRTVFELPGLSDGAVSALLQGAEALLFPSFAEGYGLPPVEAAALGVPVVCAPLAVFRETLGDYPVYLEPTDVYSWVETIVAWGKDTTPEAGQRRRAPNWEDHFNQVLNLV